MKAPGKTSPSRGGSGGSEQAGGLDDETADGILGSTLAGMVCLGGKGQHDEGSVNSGACVEATGKSAMNGRTETGPVGATEGGGLRGARISSPVDAEVSWQIEVHQNRFSSLAGAGELAAELGENHVELANPRSDSASVLSSDSQVKQREGGGCFQSPPMTGSRAGAIGQEVRSRLMRGFSSGGSGHPSVRGLGAGDAAACTGWWSTAQPHTLSATAGSPWRRNHYLPPRGRRLAPRALGTKTMWLCYGV